MCLYCEPTLRGHKCFGNKERGLFFIEDTTLNYMTAIDETFSPSNSVEINYCPMCGKWLGDE